MLGFGLFTLKSMNLTRNIRIRPRRPSFNQGTKVVRNIAPRAELLNQVLELYPRVFR
jgi:hypothetical protein